MQFICSRVIKHAPVTELNIYEVLYEIIDWKHLLFPIDLLKQNSVLNKIHNLITTNKVKINMSQ
jgi:hypothetical protein